MSERDTDARVSDSPDTEERILVVDDDPSMRTALMESVRRLGYAVQGAVDGADALERVGRFRPWLVLTDLKMPRMTGLELIKELKARAPQAAIVLMTAYGTVETAVEAMKQGASEYLLKPFSMDLLERVIANLKEGRETEGGVVPSLGTADNRAILTQDPGMVRLLSTLEGVAASQATVLINGESGTGKELLARFIHSRSSRAHRPFIAVNCAALPDGLLESELFGHERGAFTGALIRKIGKFEMAHTGTLLLDEIGEMTMGLQAKLLRVLQEREVDRVGGRDPVPVNIRVIATTNRTLYREVEQNRFREDLYYRLNVFPITLPPLRERLADIPMLARHFAAAAASRNGLPQPVLSEAALAHLQRLPWKGNIRELENVMERAVLLAGHGVILPEHCPVEIRDAAVPPVVQQPGNGSLWEMERDLIFKTLVRVKDNRTHAAKELGISIRTLRNKLREYRTDGKPLSMTTL
ncbi:MAG: sigma-54 dependent transcriptional regulator [Nitrospiraceae bacterium]|jgi:two-component system response regulator FlrC|uniref:sigma-54-dependent transcriptional regulator n=1 Tax=Nitrospira cf. moscoviensis SBR1015 TaxID=96242 RepID=UPI000A0C2E95|nr:sigma-54 dependent transcriptional regulator [Nitrospira cf. moscoviensis SBR1015]MBY0249283.1 sigma-54 dependent transcriptional regulator [Nitrospiraceae bacterium]OQW31685.1 MAG: sigma-54-dependent Fis family transcriptional regulator [Nitrospira sp. SG-bin2]